MAGEVKLSSAIRANLLSLQATASLVARTQGRLSTGLKVASAIDDAVAFFQAKSLTDRANDLTSKKNGIDQGISSLTTALQAVESTEDVFSQMKGLVLSANGLPPLSWSTVNMSKTEDQRWRTNGISRKRLSRNCGRLRFSSVKVWRVSMRSERSVLSSRRTTAGGSCMAAWAGIR